jgi:hypothetical protein
MLTPYFSEVDDVDGKQVARAWVWRHRGRGAMEHLFDQRNGHENSFEMR